MRRTIRGAVMLVVLLMLSSVIAFADPTNPVEVTEGTTSTYDITTSSQSVTAYAGNVTQLDIDGTAVTDGWAGYYGNVSGNIVLGNSNNDTMYDWNFTTITGEVYATIDASPTWGSIACATADNLNDSEVGLGFGITDIDGLNETFTVADQGDVSVGTTDLTNCRGVELDGTGVHKELALYEGANLVYASLINVGESGFDGSPWDYQMIIPENQGAGTTNYLYVELV